MKLKVNIHIASIIVYMSQPICISFSLYEQPMGITRLMKGAWSHISSLLPLNCRPGADSGFTAIVLVQRQCKLLCNELC